MQSSILSLHRWLHRPASPLSEWSVASLIVSDSGFYCFYLFRGVISRLYPSAPVRYIPKMFLYRLWSEIPCLGYLSNGHTLLEQAKWFCPGIRLYRSNTSIQCFLRFFLGRSSDIRDDKLWSLQHCWMISRNCVSIALTCFLPNPGDLFQFIRRLWKVRYHLLESLTGRHHIEECLFSHWYYHAVFSIGGTVGDVGFPSFVQKIRQKH